MGGENAAKMNHESMLTQVSSLVNAHNAKKLARKGALQSKSAENEQTYSGVNVKVSYNDPLFPNQSVFKTDRHYRVEF